MTHRGGEKGADGDGVGILLSIPDDLFRASCQFALPSAGEYGVGNVFLPSQPERRDDCVKLVERIAQKFGLRVLGWRNPVPANRGVLGPYAQWTEPHIGQVFLALKEITDITESDVDATDSSSVYQRRTPRSKRRGTVRQQEAAKVACLSLECRLFLVRRAIALRARECFVCSLSCRTIVYKGQFKPDQLFEYYLDLRSDLCTAYLAIVHSRFSTNSFPSWSRAHPFRVLAHNGEINTLEGNRNQVRAREAIMQRASAF